MKNTAKSETPEKKTSKTTSAVSDEAILHDSFSIRIGEPLPYLDKGNVKAYRTIGNGRHSAQLFALVCDKAETPRNFIKPKYANIANPNLCKVVDSGVVYWPSEDQERYVFVYEDTIGNPFIARDQKNPAMGLKPEIVLSNIVPPMIGILRELRNKEITHGEIWPGNMFDGAAKPGQKINLGECLASPVSSQLPEVYEPIERAMADPMGRGAGDILDDLYSFGASLAVMLRQEDPTKGATPEQIIEHKIEKGSYATLLGKERLSGGILELLRGLLYDDPIQRWTIEDLEAWQDGRRLSPKQAPKRAKATRPILFQNKKYTRPEILAKDLYQDPDQAAKLIESSEMDQWVERAIEDKTVKSRLEQVLSTIATFERGGSFNNRATVAVTHALYAECPVRYRNINFNPQGFGKYFTNAYVNDDEIEPFIDTIKYNFITPNIRESRSLEKGLMLTMFDNARSYSKQKGMNVGFERTLYIMNPESPCLSEILDKYYVLSSKEMIDAFEKICEKSEKATILFDRHVISYLSVKDRQNIDPYLAELSSNEPRKRILGQLKVLATIQKRLNLGTYPAICRWVLGNLDPVLAYFHDGKKRDDMLEKTKKYARDGDIKSIAALFDNLRLYEHDLDSFQQAMQQYQLIVDEQSFIEKELKKGRKYGVNTGRQIASVISMVVAFIIMFISVYLTFIG